MRSMPAIGTIVRLCDGSLAIVSSVDPDKAIVVDGREEPTNAEQIAEVLFDTDREPGADLVAVLRAYLP